MKSGNKRSKRSKTPTILTNVLHGQPLDGSGIVCIHLFVQDERGSIVEPHVLYPIVGEDGKETGKLFAKPARGRLACDSKRNIVSIVKNNVVQVTLRTDVREAVTCPKCKQSSDFLKSHIHVVNSDSDQTVKEK